MAKKYTCINCGKKMRFVGIGNFHFKGKIYCFKCFKEMIYYERCERCNTQLGKKWQPRNGKYYCPDCIKIVIKPTYKPGEDKVKKYSRIEKESNKNIEVGDSKVMKTKKCFKCHEIIGNDIFERDGRYYCRSCFDKILARDEQRRKNNKRKREAKKLDKSRSISPGKGEIKCPYCSLNFKPRQKSPTSAAGNIARGAIFLPWGVVKAVKNKPYVECPHCHMRIAQG